MGIYQANVAECDYCRTKLVKKGLLQTELIAYATDRGWKARKNEMYCPNCAGLFYGELKRIIWVNEGKSLVGLMRVSNQFMTVYLRVSDITGTDSYLDDRDVIKHLEKALPERIYYRESKNIKVGANTYRIARFDRKATERMWLRINDERHPEE